MQSEHLERKVADRPDHPGAEALPAVALMEKADAEIGTAQPEVDLIEDTLADPAPVRCHEHKIEAVLFLQRRHEKRKDLFPGKVCPAARQPGDLRFKRAKIFLIIRDGVFRLERPQQEAPFFPRLLRFHRSISFLAGKAFSNPVRHAEQKKACVE